jgi:hypothetical protein
MFYIMEGVMSSIRVLINISLNVLAVFIVAAYYYFIIL